jgi:hypothetical protein
LAINILFFLFQKGIVGKVFNLWIYWELRSYSFI